MKGVVEKHENYAVLICQGKNKGQFIIDLDIADEIAKHSWNVNGIGAIRAKIKGQVIALQRFILGAKKGDRIASNRVKPNDMRRENLRLTKAGD